MTDCGLANLNAAIEQIRNAKPAIPGSHESPYVMSRPAFDEALAKFPDIFEIVQTDDHGNPYMLQYDHPWLGPTHWIKPPLLHE